LTRNLSGFFCSLLTGVPSTSTDSAVTLSKQEAISARNSSAVSVVVFRLTRFTTGKKSAVCAGTEHLRSAEPPSVPIRNHTGPCCPMAHRSPVLSRSGFSDVGNERTNCHHSALHWEKVLWKGLEWGEKISDSAEAISASSKSPKTIPTISATPWRHFVV